MLPLIKGPATLKFLIYFWTLLFADVYQVDPAFALAVAHIESRAPGQEFRQGLLAGKWYGPFNIHKDFLKKWPVDELPENCKRGVIALRGKNHREILRRYNAEFTESYYREIENAAARYRAELREK